jgi:SAM-dependent methyltransferase
MAPHERWLAAAWPFVRGRLPPAPARIVEVGCGSAGGFVPILRANGYDATGIDPVAPAEAHYEQTAFEQAELPEPLDAVVASTSLHHVADPASVIDRIASALTRHGTLIVVEWAWEKFDRRTADWCFARLGPDEEPGWLHRRRDEWLASNLEWSRYLFAWAEGEQLHRGHELVDLLDERLERTLLDEGPYFFADLARATEADEQAAIDAGEIAATRINWVGTRR